MNLGVLGNELKPYSDAFLSTPLTTLPGVSGTRKALFEQPLGKRVVDALFHLPSDTAQTIKKSIPSVSFVQSNPLFVKLTTAGAYESKYDSRG